MAVRRHPSPQPDCPAAGIGGVRGLRHLRAVLVAGLLSLPLLSGLTTGAAAQTLPTVGFFSFDGEHPQPKVAIAAGGAVTEGGDAVFTLTAAPAPAAPISVSVTLAVEGDYGVAAGSRTVTVPTAGSATLTLATADDGADEADGSVTVTVADGDGYAAGDPAIATVDIRDDDEPQPKVAITAGGAVTEGGDAVFTLTASPAPAAPISVNVTLAVEGDYGVAAGSRTVTVPETGSATLTLATADDGADEADGSVTVTVADGDGYAAGDPAIATVDIRDDDEPQPKVAITAGGAVTEGGDAVFTLTAAPAPAAPISVSVTLAVEGDYGVAAGSRTVTVPETGSATLTLATADDGADEADGAVTVTVADGDGYAAGDPARATVVIRDDDEPAVTIAGGAVTEGGDVEFTLTASPAPAAPLTVLVRVKSEGGGGGDGTVFQLEFGRTVTIPTAGSATLTLAKASLISQYVPDAVPYSVTVTLSASAGYSVGSPGTHKLTILEPVVTVVVDGSAAVTEGDALKFELTASPVPLRPIDVAFDITFEGDYHNLSGTRRFSETFGIGVGSKQWGFWTHDDFTDEPDGSVTITLADGTGYAAGDPASAKVAIRDDDGPAHPTVAIEAGGAVTEGGDAVFTLTASPAPAAELSVTVTVAVEGDLLVAAEGEGQYGGIAAGERTVTIPAAGSATLLVPDIMGGGAGGGADERGGAVTVTVADGAGYAAGDPASAKVTVLPLTAVWFVNASSTALEGERANIGVRLNPAPSSDITLNYAEGLLTRGDDSPATAGKDYKALSGKLTVPKGATSATIPVTVIHDGEWGEGLETVYLLLDTGHGYLVLDSDVTDHKLSIVDKDVEPQTKVAIAAGGAVTEGGDAVFTLTASPAPAAELSVTVTLAVEGDYGVAAGSRTVTVPETGSATLTLATADDGADEADGSVTVTVADGDGYAAGDPAIATVDIRDDDEPQPKVAIAAGGAVTEGGDAVFTLTAAPAPAAPISVTVTLAVEGDYGVAAGSRTVTVPETGSATLTLATADDGADEADGSVTVTVADGDGYAAGDPAIATVDIRDDDEPQPKVAITAGGAVTEGGDAVFTLTAAPAPAAPISVNVTLAAEGDFGISAGSRTVTIPAAGSATLTLATADDGADEADGSVTVTVADGDGYAAGDPAIATVDIRDDEQPKVAITAGGAVTEGGDAVFTLTAAPAPAAPISVTVTLAVEGDYGVAAGSRTVTVPAAGSATLTLATADDGADEADGSVTVTVADGDGYAAGDPAIATVDIRDDDEPQPKVAIAAGGAVTEGGDAVFTLTASPAPAAELSVTVTLAVEGDYGVAAGSRTVTVPAAGSATLTLATADDGADEADGSVTVTVADGDGYAAGDPAIATVDIRDDDEPQPKVAIAAGGAVTEGGDAVFTLTASPAPAAELSVTVTVAVEGDLLVAAEGEGQYGGIAAGERTVTIPAAGSATLLVPDIMGGGAGGGADERGGAVTVTVADGAGYAAGDPASAKVTVLPLTAVWFVEESSTALEGERANIGVRLNPAPSSDITLNYAEGLLTRGDDSPATAGKDYKALSGKLTVPKGATSATIPVTVIHDGEWGEGLETVYLLLDTGHGYLVLDSDVTDHKLSIVDKDVEPQTKVAIAAGGAVTEGGDAVFTLTAAPAPAAPISVNVTLAVEGDYGVAAGSRTVTVPETGSATLTLATADDGADEADGSVTVTVADGDGYAAGDPASATVDIRDDDEPATPDYTDYQTVVNYLIEVRDNPENTAVRGNPAHIRKWNRVLAAIGHASGEEAMPASEIHANAARWPDSPFKAASEYLKSAGAQGLQGQEQQQKPEITVAAGGAVSEGGDAVFTLTANPAPAAPLAVSVTVAAEGDYGISAGSRTVTVPTTGSATLTLATAGDSADEADGSVTVTVAAGAGYAAGDPASATVDIRDDDEPATPDYTDYQTVVNYLIEVRDNPENTAVRGNPAHIRKWNRVLAAIGHASGEEAMPASEIHANAARWPDSPFKAASEYLKSAGAQGLQGQEQQQKPEITVAAGGAVSEGGDAVFTLTANPAPAAPLAVSVTVAAEGDYGISAGSRTVTVPTTGSATLTLATAGDSADEADGSVTVTVAAGGGYTVGPSASGTVVVRDDDDAPLPVVTLAAGDAVTEGGDAAFTLTATPAPAADLAVSVTVGTDGDWGVAAGGRTVTIPAAGSATLTLATTGDDADEPDGSVTVTVADGDGYAAGDPASGTVAVRDDDEPPAEVTVSVDDAEVTESGDGGSVLMTFTARLSRPAPGTVTVRASTRDSSPVSAAAREDYWPFDGKAVRFRPGQVRQSIHVLVYDDSHDEGGETFELALSDAEGAAIGDGVAVGTIVNGDPMPAAWLARFGRAVADRALDGIAARVESRGESVRAPGFRGVFAGVAIGGAGFGACPPDAGGLDSMDGGAGSAEGRGGAAADGPCAADRFGLPAGSSAAPLAAGASGSGHFGGGRFGESPTGPANGGAFAPRAGGFGGGGAPAAVGGAARGGLAQLLLGSRFTHTGGEDASGGVLGFWGRGSRTRFDGADGDLDLDGGVTTAMLGADYARGDWLAGVALAQSSGDGGYRGPAPAGDVPAGGGAAGAGSATDGRLEASLTAAVPYAAWRPSERLAVWGAAGYGAGDLALAPDGAGSVSADIGWRMAAAGLKGELFSFAGGATLSLVSDALWASTGSDRANGLVATGSAVSRLRLGVEGGRRLALPGGGSLTPKLEIGARHDGGDAEAGFGVEVGGGIAWSAPGLGLRLDLGGRTLLTHDDGAMRDRGFSASLAWDPRPDSARGLSLALRQDVGGPSGGGLDALFADDAFAGRRPGHVGRVGRVPARRTAEMGYGLAAFGGRFTGAPHLSYGTSHGAREIGLGWRLSPEAAAGAPDLGVAVLAAWRESLRDEPAERRIGIEARARW